MATPVLPRAQAASNGGGPFSREWYDFFRSLLEFVGDNSDNAAQIQEILARLDALEDEEGATIQGLQSVKVQGTLDDGVVQITLVNDGDDVGNTYYYGTDATGVKGWFNLSFLALSDTPDDYTGQSGRFVDVVSAETGLEFSALYIDHAGAIYDAGTLVYPSPVAFEDTLLVGSAGNEQDAIKINGVSTPARIKSSKFGGTATVLCHQHSTTNYPQFIMSRSNSDAASHTAVTNGMTIGGVIAVGWANSTPGYIPVGSIDFEVDATGTVSASSMPGRVSFKVTPDGSVTPVEFMAASNDGTVALAATPNVAGTDLALITQTITNGDTTHAPSGEAVFDALAGLSGTYQPLDATLTALAGQNWAANALPIGTGADTVSQVAFAANTFPARASAGSLAAKTITDGALSALAGSGGAAGFLRGDGVVANNVSGDFGIGTDTPNYAGFARAITVESTTNTAYEMASTRADADNVLIGAFTANFRTASPGHQRIADVQFTTEGSVANQRGGRLGFYTKGDGSTALSRKWSVRQNGHFTPEVDNTYDIGAPAARAAAVYTFNLIRSGALFDSGAVSPAQLTANTDNWSIAGLSTAAIIRASTNASRNVTGIASPTPWQSLLLVNIGAFDLVLVHDATSTAANRFLCPGSANLTLNPNDSVRLWYDNTSSRWRVIGV